VGEPCCFHAAVGRISDHDCHASRQSHYSPGMESHWRLHRVCMLPIKTPGLDISMNHKRPLSFIRVCDVLNRDCVFFIRVVMEVSDDILYVRGLPYQGRYADKR